MFEQVQVFKLMNKCCAEKVQLASYDHTIQITQVRLVVCLDFAQISLIFLFSCWLSYSPTPYASLHLAFPTG